MYEELRRWAGGGSVLEFGCGVGRLCRAFQSEGYLGVDASPSAVRAAIDENPDHSFLHYLGGPLPKAATVLAWTVLLHVPDDEIKETVSHLIRATNELLIIGEIMGRTWRRSGDPPVFNRDVHEYDELLYGEGFGDIYHVTRPCSRYPGSSYTVIHARRG